MYVTGDIIHKIHKEWKLIHSIVAAEMSSQQLRMDDELKIHLKLSEKMIVRKLKFLERGYGIKNNVIL